MVNLVGLGVLGVSGIRHNREFFRNIHIAGAPMFVSNLPVKIGQNIGQRLVKHQGIFVR